MIPFSIWFLIASNGGIKVFVVVEIMARRITWPALVSMATMKKPFQARESPKLAALSGRSSAISAIRSSFKPVSQARALHAKEAWSSIQVGIATLAGADLFHARLVPVLRILRALGFFVHPRAATTAILTPVFRPPISVRKVSSSRNFATLNQNSSSHNEHKGKRKREKLGDYHITSTHQIAPRKM
ncbi:LOW QUALITY PROTEIN: hypothetical protein TorRG33x02_239860 [Trema orientale]|uniref:Uncharacterized protein n=1 Tax=Trema orientale TaxID=63057 RepID=A0A2P5DWE7_TREOI|nr:LOW QUALITY PROTEIN: hypothetical protein TorRG33x02_239860 [Trema orientale]